MVFFYDKNKGCPADPRVGQTISGPRLLDALFNSPHGERGERK